jgi:hypothetical protein
VTFGTSTFSGKAEFYDATFFEMLDLRFCKFQTDKSVMLWESLENHLVYHRQTYSDLIKIYQTRGDNDTRNEVYYRFRVEKRKNEIAPFNPIRFIEWIFLDLSCGYGVKPFRVIHYSFSIILLFTFFFLRNGAIIHRDSVSSSNSKGYNTKKTERLRNAIYFSITTFTRLGFGDWYPSSIHIIIQIPFLKRRIKLIRYTTLAVIESFLGWFMLALFMVTLANVWLR